jgi:hypothetical protein
MFTRRSGLHIVCSYDCTVALTAQKAAKAERAAERVAKRAAALDRKETRAKLDAMKSRPKWLLETQAAFNAWVRARDLNAGYGCIDCGKPFEPNKPGGSVDAGHYLSRGSAPHLRFDERNVFAQRKNCNRPGGATREAFRAGVVARIGLAEVEALECDQSVKKHTAEELRGIRDDYRARTRRLLAASEFKQEEGIAQ